MAQFLITLCSLIITILLFQSPVFASVKGSDSKGFKFQSIKKGSTFEKLGFKKGDIITTYDGKNVKGVAEAMEMYKQLKKGKVNTIKVIRGGAEEAYEVE